jgi:hypothetical protein
MPSLAISQVTPIRVNDGGFRFSVNLSGGPLAPNQKALIEFGTGFGQGFVRTASVDITALVGRGPSWSGSVASFDLLTDVISCLGRNQLFEKQVKARGVIWTSDREVTVSPSSATFAAPVTPVSEASYRLAFQEFRLKYTGVGTGRLLFRVGARSEIMANYHFVYGGQFETDPQNRGFDCTTFLMAALGQFSNIATTSGEALAAQVGKQRTLNKVTRAEIVANVMAADFDRQAIVLIHTGTTDVTHHCVLVRERTVYEFNKVSAQAKGLTPAGSAGGFVTDVADWRKNDPDSVYSLFV